MNYSQVVAANAAFSLALIGIGCASDPCTPPSVRREIVEKETAVIVSSPQPNTMAGGLKPNPPPPVNILDSIRDAQLPAAQLGA